MYVDMGHGTAQRLDIPFEFTFGDAFPRHNIDS